MPLTKFVSAKWNTAAFAGEQPTISAIGDDGLSYTIPSADSDVPPWPQYLADGGTIAPAGSSLAEQITSAPADLTGGPTLGEIFNGN
jgi:hypothetical protein